MTVGDIKAQVMFQTNFDPSDQPEFLPYLLQYINDGYGRLVYAWARVHTDSESEDYQPLLLDTEVPNLPEWTHQAIADWATWLVYRNGNPVKQQRGYAFRAAFDDILSRITSENGKNGRIRNFFNIPDPH